MRAWLLLFACATGCGARSELGSEDAGHASTSATTGSSSSGASSSTATSSSGGGGASPSSSGIVAAGYEQTCAVTIAGGVQCWGRNVEGELGNASTIGSHVPVAVSGLSSGVAAIAAGDRYVCALTMAGGAQCWGNNPYGQLGNDSWGASDVPVTVSGLSSGVAAISAGVDHTCAATTAGGVLCWGFNEDGELGNDPTLWESLGPVAVPGLSSSVAAVATGDAHSCALTVAGGVMCWGYDEHGELGNDSAIQSHVPVGVSGLSSGVAAVSARGGHTCALTAAGGILCWGLNDSGQLGDNSTIESHVPVAVSGLSSGVAAVSAGWDYTCALTTAGGILCWGLNDSGQLGDNTTIESHTPVPVLGP